MPTTPKEAKRFKEVVVNCEHPSELLSLIRDFVMQADAWGATSERIFFHHESSPSGDRSEIKMVMMGYKD